MNLLDDRLAVDLAAAGSLNQVMVDRMVGLAQYARAWGAHGILFTCSAFGLAIDVVKQTIDLPTLKPNEALFDEALSLCAQLGGVRRIGLITTFAPAAVSLHEELLVAARLSAVAVQIDSACAQGAMAALNAGDAAIHDRLIVESARTLAGCDVLLLGQFSMARAQQLVAQDMGIPVLTSPDSAVRRLRLALGVTP